jgi:hypothetical protein
MTAWILITAVTVAFVVMLIAIGVEVAGYIEQGRREKQP